MRLRPQHRDLQGTRVTKQKKAQGQGLEFYLREERTFNKFWGESGSSPSRAFCFRQGRKRVSCGQMREQNESKVWAEWEVQENEVGCLWAFYQSWPNPFKTEKGAYNTRVTICIVLILGPSNFFKNTKNSFLFQLLVFVQPFASCDTPIFK